MVVFTALSHLISPRVCRICGCTLSTGEEHLCLACDLGVPRTLIHRQSFNEIHRRLGHNCHVDRAAAWFVYRRGTPYAKLLVDSKYNDLPAIDRGLGAKFAREIAAEGFFDGIDALVPMPMHWWKRLRRGYNQAEEICRGIESATSIPVLRAIKASRSHGIQSRHNRDKRFSSIQGSMAPAEGIDLSGRHVLIVDDIITSGASLAEAISALSQANPAAISVLTLGLTQMEH